jgi:hypothetical protein
MKIVDRQRKFHKQLSKMLVLLRNKESTPMEQDDKSLLSESEAEEETSPLDGLFFAESLLDLSLGATHMLLQLFDGSTTVCQELLNALLLELFSILKDKSNSVNFLYKNGNKGRAIIVVP